MGITFTIAAVHEDHKKSDMTERLNSNNYFLLALVILFHHYLFKLSLGLFFFFKLLELKFFFPSCFTVNIISL